MGLYDLVVDTTSRSSDEVAGQMLDNLRASTA